MSSAIGIITGVTVLILLILFFQNYTDSSCSGRFFSWRNTADRKIFAPNWRFLEQRNNLSRILNQKQQRLAKMECESAKNQVTSYTGGWCRNASKEHNGIHKTDRKLATALADFFQGKYVGSFGDGPGRYKQLLTDSGKLKAYDAYDGAPFCDVTSNGRVQFLDLTLPQYGLSLYDWIISLEVAEHIPEQHESIFIDNIVRHAQEGVILSWARPGQGGYSHVNNRPFSYVKTLMERLGFSHDNIETEKLRNISRFPWLKRNINVYRRKKNVTVKKIVLLHINKFIK